MDERKNPEKHPQAPAGSAQAEVPGAAPGKTLTEAARRALEEAAARRAAIDAWEAERPAEVEGRGGKDPARFGDWEVKGITSDF